ncbi:hypothetical protein DPV73_01880 [Leptospira mayottensis]|nr:hypothetical protein DPV73_01880 [Leptospira mayottensis]
MRIYTSIITTIDKESYSERNEKSRNLKGPVNIHAFNSFSEKKFLKNRFRKRNKREFSVKLKF